MIPTTIPPAADDHPGNPFPSGHKVLIELDHGRQVQVLKLESHGRGTHRGTAVCVPPTAPLAGSHEVEEGIEPEKTQ